MTIRLSKEKNRKSSRSRKYSVIKSKLLEPAKSLNETQSGFPASAHKNYKKEYESLAIVLDDYDKIVNDRLLSLRGKWDEVKVLEKTLAESAQTCKDENLL